MSAHLNRSAIERVLRFANSRWGQPNDMKSEITKAAKTRSLAIALDVYLDTLARKHDMQARALRLAARAARGEDMNTLLDASLSEEKT